MRRGIQRHAQAIADARSRRIGTAEGIPLDRLSAETDVPAWIRAQAIVAKAVAAAEAIATPFVSAADRRKAQRLALALLIAVRWIFDETTRQATALVAAVDRARDVAPPPRLQAVAALCSAPRPPAARQRLAA